MKVRLKIGIMLSFLLLLSCSKKDADRNVYTKSFGNLDFTMEHRNDKKKDGSAHFVFKVSSPEGRNYVDYFGLHKIEEWEARKNYWAYEMAQDFFAVCGNDTIPSSLYHFEQSNDVVPYRVFNVAFATPICEAEKYITLVYKDNVYNHGYIKYKFKTRQINS